MRHITRLLEWFSSRSGYLLRTKERTVVRFSRNVSYDVAILGGGAVGSSSAYFLAKRQPDLRICVIERDPTYSKASTTLSLGSIRQQFSTVENIKLSQFGYKFLSEIEEHLSVEGQNTPNVSLKKGGYLILTGKDSQILKENYKLQRELGCAVSLLSAHELKTKFPWLNTEDIAMGTLGTDREGWFDPWSLLDSFKKKSLALGVDYIHAEVTDIQLGKGNLVSSIEVVPNSHQFPKYISCGVAVNASGCWSGIVARLLGIHLPIEPRKRYVYVVDCPEFAKYHDNVLLNDISGIYCRPEGKNYLTGCCPSIDEEPSVDDLEVDYDFFTENVWPHLAHRVPAFECLKVIAAWAGFYDFNTLDCNAVIGRHPDIENLIFASGFSGHGIQHSPGTGRAVSELVLDEEFTTIDLSRLGYERVLHNMPLLENNVIG